MISKSNFWDKTCTCVAVVWHTATKWGLSNPSRERGELQGYGLVWGQSFLELMRTWGDLDQERAYQNGSQGWWLFVSGLLGLLGWGSPSSVNFHLFLKCQSSDTFDFNKWTNLIIAFCGEWEWMCRNKWILKRQKHRDKNHEMYSFMRQILISEMLNYKNIFVWDL